MLRILRGGQRWLTALFVIGIGGVFVLFLGLQGPMNLVSSPSRLVVVGPYEFDVVDFERVRQRRLEQMGDLGAALDNPAVRNSLDNLAVQELVDTALLALVAEDLGLTVSKREIEQLLLASPVFRDDSGRFDRETYEYFVDDQYGSEAAFIEDQRRSLLSFKMLRLLNRLPEVSEGEARSALRRELEELRLAALVLDPELDTEVEVSESEVAGVIAERPSEVRALYAERAEQYDRPERVRARHILISVTRDADEEAVAEALARLEQARARLEAGEAFETVAEEVSEDNGSALQGGDLGFFARGQMVPDFEDAAFALAPGETSEAVRSDFGWHLIRVEERQEALLVPFEDAREELARALLQREAALEATRQRAEQLAQRLAAGESLEELARAESLDLERSGWLRRGSPAPVPGLSASPELVAAAFALEPGASAPRPFEVEGRIALVQTLEKRPADPEDVARRLETQRESLLTAKRDTRIGAWLDARRESLLDAGELQVDLSPIRGG